MQFEKIPRLSLGFYPTPLEEMLRLRTRLGDKCPRLFVKRDDYTGAGLGGNKVRKIEFALAREIDRGTNTVVTIGGEKSNHARITAAVCAKAGLRCVLVLNGIGSNSNGNVPASRYAYEMFGAEVQWVADRTQRDPSARNLVDELTAKGEKAAYLPLGLSTPIGALGYVEAYREALTQLDALAINPSHIFHSSSSGGTQAGLIAGERIFGRGTTQIIGVSPDDPADEIAAHVVNIATGVAEELEISDVEFTKRDVIVLDDYIGDGYGIDTPESKEVQDILARSEGVLLDPLYTAKAMAAMIDWIRNGRFTSDDTILFWHTGGQLAHFYAPVSYK